MSIVQAKDSVSFTTKFPLLPFAIRHEFANNPLPAASPFFGIVDSVEQKLLDLTGSHSGDTLKL